MISPRKMVDFLMEQGIDFFTGVPDSQLREFCDYLMQELGIGKQHIIAPNEGNAVALAAGYHLATGKIGMVYMQNSGLGNAINPATSLADPKVYAIPLIYMIGWRGMPGIHDEPQHAKQGEITLQLLDVLGMEYTLLGPETTLEEVGTIFQERFLPSLSQGKSVAIVVKKGGFQAGNPYDHKTSCTLNRERAIELVLSHTTESDVVVSTTGKISREVYEQRERYGEGHGKDFLTVGSMGHASMIALQIAEQKPERRVWCLDGDGAMLMHTGALALIGARKPRNFYHVLLNNFVHESVGGLPTVANTTDFPALALACGYTAAYKVKDEAALLQILDAVKVKEGPILIEIDVSNGSRADLGRPKTSPVLNKEEFMGFLNDSGCRS